MEDFCQDENCAVHMRNDERLAQGNNGQIVSQITYVNQFVVWSYSEMSSNHLLTIMLGTTGGLDMDSCLFQPLSYDVSVYEVGHGSLSDIDPDNDPKLRLYHNQVADVAEMDKLHNELVDMIKGGTFNGADL